MKKSVIALAFALAMPAIAFAGSHATDDAVAQKTASAHGEHRSHGEHRDGHKSKAEHNKRGSGWNNEFKKIKKDLDLTDDQVKVYKGAQRAEMKSHFEIAKKYLDKMPPDDRAAMNKEHEAASQLRKDEILKVLTPEQRLKADVVFTDAKARYEKFKAELDKPKS